MSLVPYMPTRRRHNAARTIQAAYRAYKAGRNFYNSAAGQAAASAARGGYSYIMRPWAGASARRRFKLPNVRTGGYQGMEKKFRDTQLESTISTTIAGSEVDPTSLCLNAVGQGDGETNRDGRAYTILGVNIRGYILFGSQDATTVTSDHVRILLILDTQTNGSQLNAETVLDNSSGDTDLQTVAFRNLEYTQRFRVLKDMTVRKPTTGVGQSSTSTQVVSNACTKPFKCNYYFKKGLRVLCTGTADGVANIVDNSLHLIAVSINSGNTIRYISRVRFVG